MRIINLLVQSCNGKLILVHDLSTVGDDRYSTGYAGSGSSNFRKRGPLVDDVLSSFAFVLGT